MLKDDGGFVVAGKMSPDLFSFNAAVVSADSDGNVIWSRIFSDTAANAIANSIIPTYDGGYVLTGMRRDSQYMLSGFAIKLDSDGDSLWSRIISDPEQNLYLRSVVHTSDHGYALAGYHQVPSHSNDAFLCRLAPDITDVQDENIILPGEIVLRQNYPNPFNAKTSISFELRETGDFMLSVYDLLGRKIAVLAEGCFEAGSHDFLFDATNLASGIYFYNLKGENFSWTKSMILLR